MLKFMKNKKGFTLVELLIVVVILGILSSVAIPRFIITKTEAQRQTCRNNLRSMNAVIGEMLFSGYGSPPVSVLPSDVTMEMVTSYYPNGLPVCYAGGTYSVNDGIVTCDFDGHAL